MSVVHLVIVKPSGLFGAFVDDEQRANETAKAIGGVIVELPVSKDYQNPSVDALAELDEE